MSFSLSGFPGTPCPGLPGQEGVVVGAVCPEGQGPSSYGLLGDRGLLAGIGLISQKANGA